MKRVAVSADLAAADPAQPYGAALPWPKRAGARAARVAGAYVVLLGGEAALFVERGGRTLVPLRDPEEGWLRPALAAKGIPTILSGFALTESNIHSPNERMLARYFPLGVDTARALFTRLGDLG